MVRLEGAEYAMELSSPMRWAYSVWFRNLLVETDDQDYEWVAVFVIEADTADAARFWGDHLAESYARRNP